MPATSIETVYELPLPEERTEATPGVERAQSLPVPLLYENIRWFCSLRWLVIAVITVYGLMDWTGTLPSHLGLRRSNISVLAPKAKTGAAVAFALKYKLPCWGMMSMADVDDVYVVPGPYLEL